MRNCIIYGRSMYLIKDDGGLLYQILVGHEMGCISSAIVIFPDDSELWVTSSRLAPSSEIFVEFLAPRWEGKK